MSDYGYLDRKPDEGVYYETVDTKNQPVVIAAERIGEIAQVALYVNGVFESGMYPLEWLDAKDIALDQYRRFGKLRSSRKSS